MVRAKGRYGKLCGTRQKGVFGLYANNFHLTTQSSQLSVAGGHGPYPMFLIIEYPRFIIVVGTQVNLILS